MTAALLLSFAYLSQLGLKALLAEAQVQQSPAVESPRVKTKVSILQPILSGDPALAKTLEANLIIFPNSHFFWLVDHDDSSGIAICEELIARYGDRSISLSIHAPPLQGINPKVYKLAAALSHVATPFFIVLDDDTRMTATGLNALIDGLNSGASLATGLPRYNPAEGYYSGWLAEFVNSAAVLTYLPVLAFTQPLSIHGMCYAMRTNEARELDVFHRIERALTDDLALAQLLHRNKRRIHQTVQPHDIATSVSSFKNLAQILHRWFVFTRLLLEDHPWTTRLAVITFYGLPPLLAWSILGLAFFSRENAIALLVVIAIRTILVSAIKRRFLGRGVSNLPMVSLLLELAQPVLLASAFFWATIKWRKRLIRVHTMDEFEYL